jgi:CHAT domain-containing protein/Tfp pilus assembly protein PilF
LTPGAPVERELKGGEAHSYRITLAAGQYLRAVVDQRGIEVALTLHGSENQPVRPFYGPSSSQGPKELSLVAEVSGDYRLDIRAVENEAEPGRYEVRIHERREATAAEKLFAEGQLLVRQGTADSLRQAIPKFQAARAWWRQEGDRRGEAEALSGMGMPYTHVGQMGKAMEVFSEARALWHEVGEQRREAYTLNSIARLYQFLDERQKALDSFNQALALWQAVGDREEEADVLSQIGLEYYRLGELSRALDYQTQALPLQRIVRNRRGEATTLNNIGLVYLSSGELQKALESFNQALAIQRKLGKVQRGATIEEVPILNNIGLTYHRLGEPQAALSYFEQALQIARAAGFRRGEANSLEDIGITYATLGDRQKALDSLTQALQLQQTLKNRRGEGYALSGLGHVYTVLGQKSKALDSFNQALALFQTTGDQSGQAAAFNELGAVYDGLGETSKALDAYRQALTLRRAIGDRDGEASTLAGLARLERNRGNLSEARRQIETALTTVESQRRQLASQDLRASFLASKGNEYEFYVDLLMRLHQHQPSAGHEAEAVQASERARARSLLEILSEARADIRQGVEPALLQRERALQQQLNARSERLTQLLSGKYTEEQKVAAEKEVRELVRQYQDVQAHIRTRSPRYAALTQPQPLDLKEIQAQVLDDDTLLLEYALGEERSFLWAVTPRSITSFELPPRAEIETAARRVYDLLVAKAELLSPEALTTLSQMLLGPVAEQLGTKRLLIVSNGALQYVPFAALPAPGNFGFRNADFGLKKPASAIRNPQSAIDQRPLIVDHEIVTLPSASVLAVLRRELAERTPAAKTVAVLADPVFQGDDPRVKNQEKKIRNPKSEIRNKPEAQNPNSETNPQSAIRNPQLLVERSAREAGLSRFERLPLSRQEAEQITALAVAGKKMTAVDFAANRATATSAELSQYRIVHFATHSLLNSQHPELSGIVLSLVDEHGQPQDGFLRLHEIYNLKLDADLVVLSACQTALGKEIKGEGLVGLTRGFMYAGAPRVVASVWKVSDQATAELMKRFYRKMLGEGMRPAAALRAAQASMWKEKRWEAPYYWAGFVLQGEWR